MVKVMLADCDKMERDRLEQSITEEKGLQLCGSTGNGKELVELAKQVHPNVIVMDLVLPYMDGISVLEALQQEMAEERPEVIVLTRIQSETMLQAAIAGGAAYYILKPYDKKRLMNRIYEAGRAEETSMEFYSVPPARKRCDTLEQEIDRRISAAGVPHHIKGYRYLNTAIRMCIEDMDKLNGVTKDLYPSIAKAYDTTPSRVERAIRHAIEVACTRTIPDGNNELYQFLITPDGKRPTNSEFIAFMSDQIRLEGYIA